jgi:hypothetical protein
MARILRNWLRLNSIGHGWDPVATVIICAELSNLAATTVDWLGFMGSKRKFLLDSPMLLLVPRSGTDLLLVYGISLSGGIPIYEESLKRAIRSIYEHCRPITRPTQGACS